MNSSPIVCFDRTQMTMGTKHSKQLMSPKRKVKSRAPTQVCTVWKLLLPECVTGKKSNSKKHCWKKLPDEKNGKMRKVLTLEDHFSTSPTFLPAAMIGGELFVLKQSPKTKRVHPSPSPTNDNANKHDDHHEAKSSTKARGSFSLETLVLLDRKSEDYRSNSMDFSSVSRRTSNDRKSKKKVSFKPPEQNEVHFFYSPEELCMGKK